jgi:uncharacterized protein with PQ loop repeat
VGDKGTRMMTVVNYIIFFLGLLACSLTLLTVAAPMAKLKYVVKVKSTECLPFPMIVMSFFVSSFWFLYGVIEEDAYLCVNIFYTYIPLTLYLLRGSEKSQIFPQDAHILP